MNRTYPLVNMTKDPFTQDGAELRRRMLFLPILPRVELKPGLRRNREWRGIANYLISETRVLVLLNTIHMRTDGEVCAFLLKKNASVYGDYLRSRCAAFDIQTITDKEIDAAIASLKITLPLAM